MKHEYLNITFSSPNYTGEREREREREKPTHVSPSPVLLPQPPPAALIPFTIGIYGPVLHKISLLDQSHSSLPLPPSYYILLADTHHSVLEGQPNLNPNICCKLNYAELDALYNICHLKIISLPGNVGLGVMKAMKVNRSPN